MPYKTNAELPTAVKTNLTEADQTKWRTVFNQAYKEHGEEAAAIAWNAVKLNKIAKIDEDRNLVFGWAYVSVNKAGEQITDHSLEQIDPEDLEDAAYMFNLDFRESGVMHKGEAVGRLIESFVVTPTKLEKMGLEPYALPQGWWVGFYIDDDETFQKVKRGEYQMFSIQGRAVREEVMT